MSMMMGKQFTEHEQQQEMRMREMQQLHEMQWMQAQEQMKAQQMMMGEQFEQAKMLQEAQQWRNDLMMNKAHEHAVVSKEEEQASIMNSSGSMLEVMMNDPDPRFQNSQFLHFLKRIQNKEIIIEGKEIHEVKPDNGQTMEDAWKQASSAFEANKDKM